MSSPGGKAAVGLVALALIVALFFVLRDAEKEEPSTAAQPEQTASSDGENGDARPKPPAVPTIVVKGGEPVGGVAELTFTKGERIRFAVTSDIADHVHLHGYDVFKDVAPGQRVTFDVPATLEGVFEVELEDRVVPLAEITINPG